MKKKTCLIILFLLLIFIQADAKAFYVNYDKIPSKTGDVVYENDKKEVIKVLNSTNKGANKKDIEIIKKAYDKEYKTSDGFDYETYMKLTSETFNSYPNIKYDSKIEDVVVVGNYAIARMSDYTITKMTPNFGIEGKNGKLESICKYTTYLVKREDGWKIIYDYIEFEESALKFGDAENISIKFDAPLSIETNKDYDLSLTIDCPKNVFAIASIGNQEIVYPDTNINESFRKVSNKIPLERIVRSNKNGHNEYAVASIGFTRVSVQEDKFASLVNFSFKLSGMAFIMRRVNNIENSPYKGIQ